MTDASFHPRRRDDVRSQSVDGEVVLFDPRMGHAAYLNETAALIWALCDGTASVAEIAALLQREMGSSDPEIAADVSETIARFASAGLLA